MKKKMNLLKNVISSIAFVFALMMLTGLAVEPVQAAVSFKRDSISMSVGDEVYLPYLLNTNEAVEYLWDEENLDNPAVYFLLSDYSVLDGNVIWGNRAGNVNIYAATANGDYDVLNVSVYSPEYLSLNSVKKVDYYTGLICRTHAVQVGETAVYRFISEGAIPSIIGVNDENNEFLNAVYDSEYNGSTYVTTLDMVLEGGKTYYVSLGTYNSPQPFNAPNYDVSLQLTFGHVTYATGINMNVYTESALKIVGDTYYIPVGGSLGVSTNFIGGPYLVAESYEYGSSNTGAVVCVRQADGSCGVACIGSGTAEVSVTSTNGLRDAITVNAVNEAALVPGDVDFDGKVTRNDISEVFSVIKGQVSKQKIHDYADMNGDGQLNESDIQIMLEQVDGLPFVDVVSDDWFYSAIEFNYNENIMTGMDLIHFSPYEPLARAQFASILYRLNESPDVEFKAEFTDVEEGIWYTAPILWAKAEGIVNGYADGRFGPGDMITREQMAVMMYNYAVSKGYDTSASEELDAFKDAETVSEFALEEMQWAVGAGIISGKANGTELDPQGQTSRAECAVICKQFIEKIANN